MKTKNFIYFGLAIVLLGLTSGNLSAQWLTSGSNVYYNNGNVGIGTSSPAGLLHIGKQEAIAGTVGTAKRLTLQPYGHLSGPWNFNCRDDKFNAYLDLYFGTGHVYTINHSGNVGIGNTNPTGQLHIGKQEAAVGTAGAATRLTLQPYGHLSGPWNLICRDAIETAYLDFVYGSKSIYTISHEGNFGIGTPDPTHKLDVRGAIRANEVVVNSPGADFVFADDYRLRPLSEVEQFITENKHLPEIAPADSMVQNGMNVSEMQVKLLQKVEELTLYVIEQEKRIEAQQKEIEILKQK